MLVQQRMMMFDETHTVLINVSFLCKTFFFVYLRLCPDPSQGESIYNPITDTGGANVQMFALCNTMPNKALRGLQAQTLPNATPQIGKIYPFIKIAVFSP